MNEDERVSHVRVLRPVHGGWGNEVTPRTAVVGKDTEHVDVDVRRETEALALAGDDASDKGAVAEPVVERVLVRPVRTLPDVAEVGMVLAQARVKNGDLDSSPCARNTQQARKQQGSQLRSAMSDVPV